MDIEQELQRMQSGIANASPAAGNVIFHDFDKAVRIGVLAVATLRSIEHTGGPRTAALVRDALQKIEILLVMLPTNGQGGAPVSASVDGRESVLRS